NKTVTIVFSLANPTAAAAIVKVDLVGGIVPRTGTYTVEPGATTVEMFSVPAGSAGAHTLELRASEPVGTILVLVGPGRVERRTRWGNAILAKASYAAFNPLTPPLHPRVSRIGPKD